MLTVLESRYVGAGGFTTATLILMSLVVVGVVVGLVVLVHSSRKQRGR